MTREEHVAWCKKRALAELDRGSLANAWASMVSDMNKHDHTRNHNALMLGNTLLHTGHLNTSEKMRHFINDFN